jgi:hypothetical protein
MGHRVRGRESGRPGGSGVFGSEPTREHCCRDDRRAAATVDFAGVVGAGLVQINVHVPLSIDNGDAAVVATVGGASTQTTANMISIHN